jgi:hypothetical protein
LNAVVEARDLRDGVSIPLVAVAPYRAERPLRGFYQLPVSAEATASVAR